MKYKVGQVVAIRFWDHCENASEPADLTVYGRVGKVHEDYLCVDCWAYSDLDTAHDENVKRFTILRSTIIEAKEMKEKK